MRGTTGASNGHSASDAWAVSASPVAQRKLRIIIVDDEPCMLQCCEIVLRPRFPNAQLVLFADGEEAWKEILRQEPDCVISDLRRPGVDGCELLRRCAQRNARFPVIIVSGCLPTGEKWARRAAGKKLSVCFLEKPFEPKDLCAMVEFAIEFTQGPAPIDSPRGITPAHFPRPLRIVHVDDDEMSLAMLAVVFAGRFRNLELLQFQRSSAAFELLKKFDPDLLVADECMPGVPGRQIVAMLAERKARFPILVTSGFEDTNQWVDPYARQGLRISFLEVPFTVDRFFEHITRHLGQTADPG